MSTVRASAMSKKSLLSTNLHRQAAGLSMAIVELIGRLEKCIDAPDTNTRDRQTADSLAVELSALLCSVNQWLPKGVRTPADRLYRRSPMRGPSIKFSDSPLHEWYVKPRPFGEMVMTWQRIQGQAMQAFPEVRNKERSFLQILAANKKSKTPHRALTTSRTKTKKASSVHCGASGKQRAQRD